MTQQNKGSKEGKENKIEEIGFDELIQKSINLITNLFDKLINNLLYLIITVRRFIINKFLVLTIGTVIGGGLGYFLANFTSPTYETELTIRSPFLKGYNFIYEIEKLNDYLEEKNYGYLANMINAKEEELKSLKGISAEIYANHYNLYERYGEIDKKDSLMVASEINSSLFVLKISLTSNKSSVQKTEKWIIDYIAKNKNLIKNYQTRKNVLLSSEKKLSDELSSLDSLKVGVNKKILSDNYKSFGGTVEISLQNEKNILRNPIEIYQEGLKVFKDLQSIQRELQLLQALTIINSAKSKQENKSNYLFKKIIYGAIIGFSIMTFLLLIINFNKYLNKIEKAAN